MANEIAGNQRILIIGNFLSRSHFTWTISEELFHRLSEKGWSVITTSAKNNRIARLFDMIYTTWINKKKYSCAQVDVYSGPAFLYAEAVSLFLRILRKPFLLTLHGGNLPAFAQRWPIRLHNLLKGADAVGTPSLYIQMNLKSSREDIIYLPNGINLNRYNFRLRSQPAFRMAWLRAFHQIYNPAMAVRTLALLAKEYPDIQLQMTGPDKGDGSLPEVRNLAEQFGIGKNLHITLGIPKEEVPRHLCGFDIFLNTTNYESFGVSVMEAAASGMCIVTTNVGELSYLWQDGHDALLVPPNDPEAMAAAVRRILTEPGLAERLSFNARKKAEQFDWSIILPQWEALLTKVAQGKEK
ncbi:MAG: glycosyltransferase family 4 protein [Thermodesulfobacteriota bacterium]